MAVLKKYSANRPTFAGLNAKLLALVGLKAAVLLAAWVGVGKFLPPDSIARLGLRLIIGFTLLAVLAWLVLQWAVAAKSWQPPKPD